MESTIVQWDRCLEGMNGQQQDDDVCKQNSELPSCVSDIETVVWWWWIIDATSHSFQICLQSRSTHVRSMSMGHGLLNRAWCLYIILRDSSPTLPMRGFFDERLGCSSNTCEPTKDLDPNWAVGMLDLHEATQFTILDTAATNLFETITSTT